MTDDQKKIIIKILDDMFIMINSSQGSNTAHIKIEMYALVFTVAYANGFTPEEIFTKIKHIDTISALEATKQLMKAIDDENKKIREDHKLDLSIKVNDNSKRIH